MKTMLSYGRSGLPVELSDGWDVLRVEPVPGLINEAEAIRAALRSPIAAAPLREQVRPGMSVVIAHSDITRATPNERILPVLLEELEHAGVMRKDITLLNALGTHRRQSEAELRAMLGSRVVDSCRCLQHDAFNDSELISLGTTSFGHPVRLNRILIEADFKILTGFIEPHFFAGFSGGPKGVLPALAGSESVFTNHSQAMIADPRATWGITHGNPIWEEMREMALRVNPSFLLNVTMNPAKEITGVFAGDVIAAHQAGTEFVRAHAMVTVDAPYDVVITTNSGYPLDQNLYQCVKGMSAACGIVRRGGAILMAAACEDGLPDHGRYAQLLKDGGSPQGVLRMLNQPGFSAHDQWQVQIQAMIQSHADVYVYSQGLTEDQIRAALFLPCADVAQTARQLTERCGSRVCVLPEGPLTICQLRKD